MSVINPSQTFYFFKMRNKVVAALLPNDDDDDDSSEDDYMGFPNPTGHGTDRPFYFDVDFEDSTYVPGADGDGFRICEFAVLFNDSGVAKLVKGMKYTLDVQGYGYTDIGSKHKVFQFQAMGYIQLQTYRIEQIAPGPDQPPRPTRVDFRAFQEGFPRFFSKGHNSCSVGDLVMQPNTCLLIRVIFYDMVSEVRIFDATNNTTQPYITSWDFAAANFDAKGYLTGVCTVSNYIEPDNHAPLGR